MLIRITTVSALALTMMGCNPVTKSGMEARKQAMSRMDQANASMTRKQAAGAFETGQLDKARKLITESIERYPDHAESWALLGRVLMEQTHLDQAVLAMNKAIELEPGHAPTHYFLGVIHERWSKDHRAAECYEAAFEAEPHRAQYLMAAAESRVATGDVSGARSLIEDNLDRFEHHAAMQHLLAHISMLEGDATAAALRCEEARLLAPEDESIARDLCRMRFRTGDWAGCLDAIDDWQQRFGQRDAMLEHVQARCLVLVRRDNEARATYRTLCKQDPENVTYWRERGMLAWAQEDWDTLATCATQLMSLRPGMYESALLQAVSARAAGAVGKARALLEDLVVAHPDRSKAWALLASIRSGAGDLTGAEKARQIAVKCDPSLADLPRVTGVFGTQGH
ncbi:MAG: tetratricopeptide repeat protein [Phycisphaerales bacterium]|nr:tetratricopeptide repeat protein [Phycisphaerales bacterium]